MLANLRAGMSGGGVVGLCVLQIWELGRQSQIVQPSGPRSHLHGLSQFFFALTVEIVVWLLQL